jgi:hypothetical protein
MIIGSFLEIPIVNEDAIAITDIEPGLPVVIGIYSSGVLAHTVTWPGYL